MQKRQKVVLLIESSRVYGEGLLAGIARYSRLHGPWAFYWETEDFRKILPRLKKWHSDGIILQEPESMEKFVDLQVPAIIRQRTNNKIVGFSNIFCDNEAVGIMAAEHLLSCRFRQYAYCGIENAFWSCIRGESFRKKIAEAGFDVHFYTHPQLQLSYVREKEQAVMDTWLKSLPKPIGLLACNDDRGRQIIEACKTAGISIPEEIAIVGVDNDELVCEIYDPPLSSVALNIEKAGYEAAELLDKLMRGEKPADSTVIIIPTHVVARQSSNILTIKDKEVADTLKFIRQHCKKPIQVGEVAEAVAISRRLLQKRFQEILGYSVSEEIKRVRVAEVARMLVETSLTLSEIATVLEYSSAKHMSEFFRKQKGISPLAYRKHYGQMQ
ncbi:MAG: XylR family transcriptional regulator [Sedimentisphaerales bacterium]